MYAPNVLSRSASMAASFWSNVAEPGDAPREPGKGDHDGDGACEDGGAQMRHAPQHDREKHRRDEEAVVRAATTARTETKPRSAQWR